MPLAIVVAFKLVGAGVNFAGAGICLAILLNLPVNEGVLVWVLTVSAACGIWAGQVFGIAILLWAVVDIVLPRNQANGG